MQSIFYCVKNGIEVFEGGAQGQHKMARGLMPVKTYSAHYVADKRFYTAIESFLRREIEEVDGYVDGLQTASPYRRLCD